MSVQSEINRIKAGKTSIVSSIESKGVTVPSSAKIDGLSEYIDGIGTVIQLETLIIAPMTNAEINANLVAGAFVKVAENFVTMADLANGATVNNVAIPSSSFYELFEGVISTQQMHFVSVLPVAVGKDLDGIVFNESGTYVLAQACQTGIEITIPNFHFIKTLEVVERGTTTLTSRRNTSNNTIVLTAENNQSAGYTAGGKSTATKTVSLSASGKTVTATDGTTSISQDVTAGSATTPPTTITKNPTITVNSSGVISASVSGTQSVTPTVSAGYVSSGTAGTITVSGSATKQLTTQAAKTVTPSTSNQTAVESGRYTTGAVTVKGDANLVAGNIKKGVSIFGVAGSFEGGTKIDTCTVVLDVSTFQAYSGTVSVFYTQMSGGAVGSTPMTYSTSGSLSTITLSNVVCGSAVCVFTSVMSYHDATAGETTGYGMTHFITPTVGAGGRETITFTADD